MLACSRIFWIAAERLGFVGRGGGGVWWDSGGRERRVRWRVLRSVRVEGRSWEVEDVVEAVEMDLVDGSIVRGRRVNVSSMIV